MSEVRYPYMPEGCVFRFVGEDHPLMLAAARARAECAGDRLFPVGAVLARDGVVLARAGNGYDRGEGFVHVCPRVVLECPSGTGYELCDFHDAAGHAEPMLIAAARGQGRDPSGADVYLYGHWWCCEPCWSVMREAGVRDVYLVQDAHELFTRERVYAQTLQSRVKRAYIAGAYTNNNALATDKPVHIAFGAVCAGLGCQAVILFRDQEENKKPQEARDVKRVYQWSEDELRACDVLIADVSHPSLGAGGELALARIFEKPIVLVSKNGSLVSNFALGNPNVVYHLVYDDVETACRQLKNVLRQL
ncbi:hypothetical protein FJZ23_03275 [Candidatus Parcubacteria bacterium]|nr:hypothetical protein [Candidatus Parcubacteria bacterium]